MLALAGEFVDDLHVLQCTDRGEDGRRTERQQRLHLRYANQYTARELVEHQPDIAGAGAELGDAVAVLDEQRQPLLRHGHSLLRGVGHAIEKKARPTLPVALCAHRVEAVMVFGAMPFKIQAGVAQHALMAQDQSDQQPAQAVVAAAENA